MRTRFHYAIRGQRKDVRTWLNNEIAAGKVLLTIRINAITPYMFCLDIVAVKLTITAPTSKVLTNAQHVMRVFFCFKEDVLVCTL